MSMVIKVGLTSYAFTWALGVPGYPSPPRPLTAFELVEAASGLQAPVLQLADNVPIQTLSRKDLERLRDLAKAKGIELQLGMRGIELEKFALFVDIARILEAPLIRTLFEVDHDPCQLDQTMFVLRKVTPNLEKHDLILAIENYEGCRASTLKYIVETLRSKNLGVCLDTANSIGILENPYEVALSLAPFVKCIHVKNVTIFRPPHRQGFVVEGCPLNEGLLDIEMLLQTVFSRVKTIPAVLVELWVPFRGTVEDTILLETQWRSASVEAARALVHRLLHTIDT